MTPLFSRDDALWLFPTCLGLGGIAAAAGAPRAETLSWVVFAWVLIALWQVGRIDGKRFRIDPLWLFFLVEAGVLWQAGTVGPDVEQGLMRALAGAGTGLLLGAVPIIAAEVLGRRWPFFPGDALLFAALGCALGPRGLFWALSVGAFCALARHALVQRRRGRSWLQGQVPLGPGMAVGGALVLSANVLGRAGIGLG